MAFTAQELNHKVTFEEQQTTRDEWGGEVVAWVQVAEGFAKFEPLVGREYFAARSLATEEQAKFTMRYRNDLSPSMRLMHDGQPWDITSIIKVRGQNREILIYAKRIE